MRPRMTRRVGTRYPVFTIVTYRRPKGGEKRVVEKQHSRINHQYGKNIYSLTNATERIFQTFGQFLECFLALLDRGSHTQRSSFLTFATMQYQSSSFNLCLSTEAKGTRVTVQRTTMKLHGRVSYVSRSSLLPIVGS